MSTKQKYRVMKVFDCTDMPEDLKRSFYKLFDLTNDSAVEWTVKESVFEEEDYEDEAVKTTVAVDDWLIKHGAADSAGKNQSGETVLIKYWW